MQSSRWSAVVAEPLTVAVTMVWAGRRLELNLSTTQQIVVVMGPSGAGKTSLLSSLAGLVRPSGKITVGADVWLDERHFVPAQDRRVGLVPQTLALFPHLDAEANVAFGIDRALPSLERTQRARAMLERMRVGHLGRRRPATYSGGEAQRVALARAFARRPRLVLLDEPFSALDQPLRQALVSDVKILVSELDATLVHVTHDEDEAARLGGEIHRLV